MALGRDTTFTWYGHACVEVRTPGGKTILIDPWFGNPDRPKPADSVDRVRPDARHPRARRPLRRRGRARQPARTRPGRASTR